MVNATDECPSWSDTTLWVNVRPQQCGSVGVPQIVEPDAGQSGALCQSSEGLGEQIGVNRPAVSPFHDEVRGLPHDAE